MRLHAAAALALLVGGSSTKSVSSTEWTRLLLNETDAPDRKIAVCLDGSPGAYYVKPGTGENATKFIVSLRRVSSRARCG